MKNDIEKLHKILNGERTKINESKAYFPLLEEDAIKETGHSIGILESVTIKVHSAKKENKFIIVPSEKDIEEKISEQVKQSWLNAMKIAIKYVRRIHPHHEVIISFDKKAGFCKGNSLGTALTLAFIEEIFKTYNSPVAIKVGDGIAFTGGMNELGIVTNTSDEIIKQKTELIFFSNISLLIVPKNEESAANEKLNALKKEFPQRDLKIIGVEDISDLLDRRTIVEIKKQPLIVRSGKFVKKNWVGAAIAVLLTIVLSFLFVLDFDDNPAILTSDGTTLFVKNKNGKILWSLKIASNLELSVSPELIKLLAKTIDVNDDGSNELIFIQTTGNEENERKDKATILCYDKNKLVLWKYTFQDTVYSEREDLRPLYAAYLIDTATINNQKSILCFANNMTSFSSAIFALELETGKRLNQTQWNSGFTWDADIIDMDEDGEKEVVAIGADNGFNDGVIYCVELKKLNGCRPTTPEYRIKNFTQTELIFYIRLPRTDYDSLNGGRVNGLMEGSLSYNVEGKEFNITSISFMDKTQKVGFPSRNYIFKVNTLEIEFKMIDKFSSQRDEQVRAGVLSGPYTDTKQYKEILKSQILYFKNNKWVNRIGLSIKKLP